MGTLQWFSLIALNYVAKSKGVKRGMTAYEALEVCPDMIFVHVATIVEQNTNQKYDHIKSKISTDEQ